MPTTYNNFINHHSLIPTKLQPSQSFINSSFQPIPSQSNFLQTINQCLDNLILSQSNLSEIVEIIDSYCRCLHENRPSQQEYSELAKLLRDYGQLQGADKYGLIKKQMIKKYNKVTVGIKEGVVHHLGYQALAKDFSVQKWKQMMELQHIRHETQFFARILNFKLSQITISNLSVLNLQTKIHPDTLSKLSFSMETSELQTIFLILSTLSINTSKTGIFIYNYFFRAIGRLKKQNKRYSQINAMLKQSLKFIVSQYSQKLQEKDLTFIEALRNLQKKNNCKQSNLINLPKARKKQTLNTSLRSYIRKAQHSRPHFQNILRMLSSKTVYCNSQLRYINLMNDSALFKIQMQQLLLKDKKYFKRDCKLVQNLDDEEDFYDRMLQQQILNCETVQLQCLLIGQCIFEEKIDVLDSVARIKNFIEGQNSENTHLYKVIEIQTLKFGQISITLLINQAVCCRIDIILKSNWPIYNYCHPIEEIIYSDDFSPSKIIQDRYYQSHQEIQSFCLFNNQENQAITQYFGLMNLPKVPRLNQLIIPEQSQGKYFCHSIQKYDLLLCAIILSNTQQKKMGFMTNILTAIFQTTHQQSAVKQILYSVLIEDQDPVQYVQIIQTSYQKYFYNLFYHQLSIDKLSSMRLLLQIYQLEYLCGKQQDSKQKYNYKQLILNVYGRYSEQYSELLVKQGEILRKSGDIKGSLKKYIKSSQTGQGINSKFYEVYFAIIENSIILSSLSEAYRVLQDLQWHYRNNLHYSLVLLCSLLKAECLLYQSSDYQAFCASYQSLYSQFKTLLPLSNHYFINSQCRIAKFLFSLPFFLEQQGKFLRTKTFENHIRIPIYESGLLKPQQLYQKLESTRTFQVQRALGLQPIKFKHNPTIKQYKSVQPRQSTYYVMLSRVNWPNLKKLNLSNNQITDTQCQLLSQAQWPHLNFLNLKNNQITSAGSQFLTEAAWPLLQYVLLKNNKLKDKGCQMISNGKWKYLKKLNVAGNQVTDLGCLYLLEREWEYLELLELQNNLISDELCDRIENKKFMRFHMICLHGNNITDSGYLKIGSILGTTIIQKIL